MSKSFKDMTNQELSKFMDRHPEDELAFEEYHSRFNWTQVPANTPLEEQKRIIEDLIAKKTKQ